VVLIFNELLIRKLHNDAVSNWEVIFVQFSVWSIITDEL